MTLADKDKQDGIDIAQRFEALGYKIYASRGTAKVLRENGVNAIQVNKIGQEAPTLLDLILEHKIDLVIDTPEMVLREQEMASLSEDMLSRQAFTALQVLIQHMLLSQVLSMHLIIRSFLLLILLR